MFYQQWDVLCTVLWCECIFPFIPFRIGFYCLQCTDVNVDMAVKKLAFMEAGMVGRMVQVCLPMSAGNELWLEIWGCALASPLGCRVTTISW